MKAPFPYSHLFKAAPGADDRRARLRVALTVGAANPTAGRAIGHGRGHCRVCARRGQPSCEDSHANGFPISDAVGSKDWTVEPNPETMVRLRSTSIEVSRVFSANHRKVIIAAIM